MKWHFTCRAEFHRSWHVLHAVLAVLRELKFPNFLKNETTLTHFWASREGSSIGTQYKLLISAIDCLVLEQLEPCTKINTSRMLHKKNICTRLHNFPTIYELLKTCAELASFTSRASQQKGWFERNSPRQTSNRQHIAWNCPTVCSVSLVACLFWPTVTSR